MKSDQIGLHRIEGSREGTTGPRPILCSLQTNSQKSALATGGEFPGKVGIAVTENNTVVPCGLESISSSLRLLFSTPVAIDIPV
jgi:hypothetical protein